MSLPPINGYRSNPQLTGKIADVETTLDKGRRAFTELVRILTWGGTTFRSSQTQHSLNLAEQNHQHVTLGTEPRTIKTSQVLPELPCNQKPNSSLQALLVLNSSHLGNLEALAASVDHLSSGFF